MASDLPKRFVVYWEKQRVLEITDKPGLLVSKLAPPPPPGTPLAWHPFLSATALVPEHEQKLRDLLDHSTSLDEYLKNLRAAGYVVVEEVRQNPR